MREAIEARDHEQQIMGLAAVYSQHRLACIISSLWPAKSGKVAWTKLEDASEVPPEALAPALVRLVTRESDEITFEQIFRECAKRPNSEGMRRDGNETKRRRLQVEKTVSFVEDAGPSQTAEHRRWAPKPSSAD